MDIGNLDLSLLLALKLRRNWNANLRIIMAVEDEEELPKAQQFISDLQTLARLPETEAVIEAAPFHEFAARAPQADLNIFGMDEHPDLRSVRVLVETTGASCIFVRDSGKESALA